MLLITCWLLNDGGCLQSVVCYALRGVVVCCVPSIVVFVCDVACCALCGACCLVVGVVCWCLVLLVVRDCLSVLAFFCCLLLFGVCCVLVLVVVVGCWCWLYAVCL